MRRRRVIAGVLFGVLAGQAAAQEPPLGRLFLTPEQRAALDNARRNKIRAEATRPKAAPSARDLRIDGIVRRSDGEAFVWVNGKPVEDETTDSVRVAPLPGTQSSVVVRDLDKGRVLRLKVGQRADLLTGRITEDYESRRVQAAQEIKQETVQEAGTGDSGSRPSTTLTKRRDRVEDDTPDTQGPDEGK